MSAYDRDFDQRNMVAAYEAKRKIYKEIPQDRSGRDSQNGREFYDKAEELHNAVSTVKHLNLPKPMFQDPFL